MMRALVSYMALPAKPTLKDYAQFIIKVGSWTVLAGYLVVQISGDVRANGAEALRILRGHETTTDRLVELAEQQVLLLQRQSIQDLQNCVNDARADDVRHDACFAAAMGVPPTKR